MTTIKASGLALMRMASVLPTAGTTRPRPDHTDGDPYTVQAHCLGANERIDLDGRLDEQIWQRLTPATGFIQHDPNLGDPALNETETRFCCDSQNL